MIVRDDAKTGSWTNFRRAAEALLRQDGLDDFDAIGIFQDDILLARGAADFLVRELWPTDTPDRVGVVSLYTAGVNHREEHGWFELRSLGRDGFRPFGALAYVLPVIIARDILHSQFSANCPTGTDTSIGSYCLQKGLEYWSFSPSLVQHIGSCSSINENFTERADDPEMALNRRASHFCSDVNDLC